MLSEEQLHIEKVKAEAQRKQEVKEEKERQLAVKMEEKRKKREAKEAKKRKEERANLRAEIEAQFIAKEAAIRQACNYENEAPSTLDFIIVYFRLLKVLLQEQIKCSDFTLEFIFDV